MEVVSEQGYRGDGRKPGEARRLACKLGVYQQADGSAFLQQGPLLLLLLCSSPPLLLSEKGKLGGLEG